MDSRPLETSPWQPKKSSPKEKQLFKALTIMKEKERILHWSSNDRLQGNYRGNETLVPVRDLNRIFFPFHEIDYMLISLSLMGFSFLSYFNQFFFNLLHVNQSSLINNSSINYLFRFKISHLDLGSFIGKLHTKKVGAIGLAGRWLSPMD